NDTLTGTSGANVISGGSGNDALRGDGGDDTLDGGTGVDTASYSGISTDYIITDLGGGAYTVTDIRGVPFDGTDTLTGIEFVTFSDGTFDIAERAAAIFGTEGDDTLTGTPDDDEINALGGNDTITGGGGNDVIDGGDGSDTVIFPGNFADADIYNDGAGAIIVTTAAGGTDTVTNAEFLQFADRTVDV
ncbi:calcium-binding protein, partial [Tepidamorphus sp. 3E244]|uniref:calcium-binding protein n=1 Tax=Tepidamorphus sp. 3E244 TaxID=3385498 RepID=UPI0038FCAFF1